MTSYAPVAVTGSVVDEPQGQSAEGDRFNGNGGARRGWWWQAGPVDSCCCCFSLGTGVVLTAADSLFGGIWILYLNRAIYAFTLETLQEQYAQSCKDSAANTLDCEQLKDAIEQADGIFHILHHLPMVVYVQGFLSIVAGMVGVCAVLVKSKQAAKVYMWSWPVKFVLAVWGALEARSLMIKYDAKEGNTWIIYLVSFIIVLYYFKVSWSYYKRTLEYSSVAPSSGRSASLDTGYRAMPMLGMNTNV